MGDPFQSVGEPSQPRKVKLQDGEDKEGIDKLRQVRGQSIDKGLPIATVLGAAANVAAGVLGGGGGGQSGPSPQQQQDDEDFYDAGTGDFGSAYSHESRPTKTDRKLKEQQHQFKNLNYSEINEGRVDQEIPNLDKAMSNEGGLGVDDPEAPNSGIGRHYDRMRDDEGK